MAQTFPLVEGFSTNGLQYDTYHRGYIRTRLKSTTETIDIYTARGWSATASISDAHAVSGTDRNATSTEGTGSQNLATTFVFRELISALDCKVTLTARQHMPFSESINTNQWRGAGVVARHTGGAVSAGGTAATVVNNCDGYFFGLFNSGTPQAVVRARYILGRYNAGTLTVLASVDFDGTPYTIGVGIGFDLTAAFDPRVDFDLRMELEDEGGDVRIKCYRVHTDPTSEEVELISYLDNSGSKLTAEGRFGFYIHGALSSTGRSMALAEAFQVELGGVLALRDEFYREHNFANAVTDFYGFSGVDLSPLWSGEQGSQAIANLRLSTIAGLLDRGMIAPRVANEGAGSASGSEPYPGGYFLHRVPAVDPEASRVSVVFRFSSTTDQGLASVEDATHFARAGVVARAVASAISTVSAGYMAEISPGGAGSPFVKLWRYDGGADSSAVLIASKTVGVTLARDADHVLDLSVFNHPDPSGAHNPANAVVGLAVVLNGMLVDLTPTGSGITLGGAGEIVDANAARWLSGSIEGFRLFAPPTINTVAVYVDDHAQGVPGISGHFWATLVDVDAASSLVSMGYPFEATVLDLDGLAGSAMSIPTPTEFAGKSVFDHARPRIG